KNEHLSLRRRQKARQHLDGSRFAGPVGPEEAIKRPALDAQVDGIDGAEIAEEARQLVGFDSQTHDVLSPQAWRADAGGWLRFIPSYPNQEGLSTLPFRTQATWPTIQSLG